MVVNYETMQEIIVEAKKYGKDDFKLFCDEYGWQEWMNDFTDAKDGEPITEREAENIDKILKEAFCIAHKD